MAKYDSVLKIDYVVIPSKVHCGGKAFWNVNRDCSQTNTIINSI